MTIKHHANTDWRRLHDRRDGPPAAEAEDVISFDGVADAFAICRGRNGRHLTASGSHWALSGAAVADNLFVETNIPGEEGDEPRLSGFAGDMDEIASAALIDHLAAEPPARAELLTSDPCLRYGFGPFFVHLLAGTRIYEAYSLLDRKVEPGAGGAFVETLRTRLIAEHKPIDAYDGPWGFATLGGAGGQTVFGALTTGTHGGDYRQRPISDYVAALHLVTDEGRQFWIEPSPRRFPCTIADDAKLRAKYPPSPGPAGPIPLEIIRDSKIFDAVMVGAGRFGIVTSIVLAVMPQYSLLEHRDLINWDTVRDILLGPGGFRTFDSPFFPDDDGGEKITKFERRFRTSTGNAQNRFLQIAVNVSPHGHNHHKCGVTQRWWVPQSAPEATHGDGAVAGRAERGTPETAGKSFPYNPPAPDDPREEQERPQTSGTFIDRACANGSFIAGLLRSLAIEIQDTIDLGHVPLGGAITAAIAIGTGSSVLAVAAGLCAALAAAIIILKTLADAIEAAGDDTSLASAAHGAAREILGSPFIPQAIALLILRTLFLKLFESQQGNRDFVAISYAMMDTHDYHDRSCYGDAASMEVFFDANQPATYCAYLDRILAFEGAQQANNSRVTIGYVSLRYIRGSEALIAPARFLDTVVLEIAEIRHDDGSAPFVDNAIAVARHPMFAAAFHWGQINPLGAEEVEHIFNAAPKPGALKDWREALRRILRDCPAKDAFSNPFTRQTGLEP